MSTLKLSSVEKVYGHVEVIKGIDLEVQHREFVVLVGPSGCGKSTLLRMIAGLEEITAGQLMIDGTIMNDVPADARGLAMVFQSYALYPHMSVSDNMGFALKLAGVPKAERDAKMFEAARILQLEQLLDRKPKQLSGGQRQRVAIGRAIVRQPKIFLFDEPLSNLDAALQVQMRIQLAELHRRLNPTMIYVTHDQVEAMTMATRIVVMRGGVIEQVGTPLELYERPANTFVAGFIGSPKMNLISSEVLEYSTGTAKLSLSGGSIVELRTSVPVRPGQSVTLGIRPEGVALRDTGQIHGEVDVIERLGSETLCYIDIGARELVTAKLVAKVPVEVGQKVRIDLDPDQALLFDESGNALST